MGGAAPMTGEKNPQSEDQGSPRRLPAYLYSEQRSYRAVPTYQNEIGAEIPFRDGKNRKRRARWTELGRYHGLHNPFSQRLEAPAR
jgi:hypothetical protein